MTSTPAYPAYATTKASRKLPKHRRGEWQVVFRDAIHSQTELLASLGLKHLLLAWPTPLGVWTDVLRVDSHTYCGTCRNSTHFTSYMARNANYY